MQNRTSRPRVAVVGGGLAGLECALGLLKEGCSVEVIEVGHQSRKRHVYWDPSKHIGDDKVQRWTSEAWGAGGGLSERFGGRSLCYHGVFLEPAQPIGPIWGKIWEDRLTGDKGLYKEITAKLADYYTELQSPNEYAHSNELNLHHVPQAARLDEQARFEAYSPLYELSHFIGLEQLKITKGLATRASLKPDGWRVIVQGSTAEEELDRRFDACVLATSAICNMQILASSLKRDITTTITDHFCIGILVKISDGKKLGPFRHKMIWSGYVPVPELASNIFFSERSQLPTGERIIELTACIEQAGNPDQYSTLSVRRNVEGSPQTHIHGNISVKDVARLELMRAELKCWAEKIAGHSLKQIAARFSNYDTAMAAIIGSEDSRVFCAYEWPYGAFEHESCSHPIGDTSGISISNDLEVLELPGMYVSGPGVFPRLTEANPALTIVAVSQGLARLLSSKFE